MLKELLISMPMMVCFFWSIFFLIRCWKSDEEKGVKGTITVFFIVATILYLDHWLFFSGHVYTAGEWSYGVVNLCVYPIYYAYLRALTRAKLSWEVPVLLIPAAMAIILFPIGQFTGLLTDAQTFLIIRICFTIQVIWVLIRGYQLLIRTIRRMDNTYSDDRSRLLLPTRISLVLFGITSVVSMILNFIGRESFAHEAPIAIPAIIMSSLLFGLGYVAAHTIIPQETVEPENAGEKEHAMRATTAEADELIHKIGTIMREQQLFADPHLTIQDLATAIGSNRTYVSNCINSCTGYSFSQYVARYRVEHAQQILCNPKYTSDKTAIADAILLSGFSSKQTFYRIFKDVTGFTPLQFRQKKG